MTSAEWPVWPEGVEGVLIRRLPADHEPGEVVCFVCAGAVDAGENCWGLESGIAHERCYEPAALPHPSEPASAPVDLTQKDVP